jgi:glycosyltransferase involved in cell wall biosynthesis
MSPSGDPLVTVCVPVIGRLDYFQELIDSIRAQTLQDFEVIILDSASAADAREVYARHAAADPRIRVSRVEQCIPMFANFNRGLNEARGEYIAYFHDDDVYLPRFLEVMTAQLRAHPSAAFSGSNYYIIDETGEIRGERRLIRRTGTVSGRRFALDLARLGRCAMHTSGVVYRTGVLRAVTFDESLSMHFGDFVIFMRLSEGRDVALIEEPLMQVRIHAGAASSGMPLSEGVRYRTAIFRDYARDFAARHPHDTGYPRELESAIRRSNRIGLVWGWLAAPDDDEARACEAALGAAQPDRSIRAGLRALGALGVSPSVRRRSLAPLVRRIGRRVG